MNWIVWLLTGLATSALHLVMLRRAVNALHACSPAQAQRAVMRGVPLRLLALTPVLYLVARAGLIASLAWLAGCVIARAAIGWYVCFRKERRTDGGQIAP
jgi:hypothetical protein